MSIKKKSKTYRITYMAIISAMYTVLSLIVSPIAFGPIQFRISEVLTLLALVGSDEIYAITLGCFLTNLLGVAFSINSAGVLDIVFGTLATFIAGKLTYKFRNVRIKGWPVLSALMPVVINGIIIGLELAVTLNDGASFVAIWLIYGLEVAIGELGACVILGVPIWHFILERRIFDDK